jgi:hypothetical protein
LYPRRHEYNWVSGGNVPDGTVLGLAAGSKFVLKDLVTQKARLLESSKDHPFPDGYTLNADQTKVLLAVNRTAGFRYSCKANYLIVDLKENTTKPLFDEQKGDVQAAEWNPK